MNVSPHLTFAEATVTQDRDLEILAAQANPPAHVRQNLLHTALDLFEPARELCGPLRVNSGYRCPRLNAKIGGSKTSAHMAGLAFDVVPTRMHLVDAFKRIVESAIPYDQAIYELGRWIHIGAAPHGAVPRRQALMFFGSGYEPFNASDPRVRGVEAI